MIGRCTPCSFVLGIQVRSQLCAIPFGSVEADCAERCLSYDEKPLLLFQKLKEGGQKPVFMLRHIVSCHTSIILCGRASSHPTERYPIPHQRRTEETSSEARTSRRFQSQRPPQSPAQYRYDHLTHQTRFFRPLHHCRHTTAGSSTGRCVPGITIACARRERAATAATTAAGGESGR